MPHIAAFLMVLGFHPGANVAGEPDRNSLRPLDEKLFSYAEAAHLLRRAGFGGTPEEVQRLVDLGAQAAVDHLVDFDRMSFPFPPPPIDPMVTEPPDRAELRSLSPQEREKYQEERRRAERRALEETRLWWIDRMLRSPRPLEEKMTLFWHGHFTSGAREVRSAVLMKEQNEFLRRHCLDSFRELLLGISRNRAMLTYLDGNRNVKAAPNENYARELLELFTLGVDNYSESDIKAAARAFTGWTFDENGFVFRRRNHDYGSKTFLGKTGDFDGADIIDIVLQQPDCPKHLARKLLAFFVRPEPDKALVEALAREIRKQDYDMKAVMRTLLRSEAFYSSASRGALIKSPVEVVVTSARQLGASVANLAAAERAMAAMGQELFQPPNVKGWPGGEAWINTATLFTRYNTAGGLVFGEPGARPRRPRAEAANDESPGTDESMMMKDGEMAAQSRMTGGRQPPLAVVRLLRERGVRTAEDAVALFVSHLCAGGLPAAKQAELVRYLQGDDGKFSLDDKDAEERLRTALHLLLSTPEYQMN